MVYESYNAYLSVTKSTPEEFYKQSFGDIINASFDDASTIKTVKHNGVDIVVRVVRVFNKESLNRRIDSLKKIIFKGADYVVSAGDIFEFDNKKWLCIDVGGTVYNKSCTVGKCNDVLNVVIDNNIIEVPYFVLDNIALTRMGIDESKYITVPNSKMLIMVADNEINRQIQRDDIYKLKNIDNYKVVDINRVRFNGLIILELEFSQQEQEIPDNEEIINGYEIVGDSEVLINQTKSYEAIKYVNGEIDNTVEFIFEIIAEDIPISAYTLTVINNTECQITANEAPHDLVLRATDTGNNEYIEKVVKLRRVF